MAAEETKKPTMKYVHFLITVALMFLFRFIPPIGPITPYGMAVLGIFIGLIYGWSVDADNLLWPSLLGLVALGMTDFGTAGKAIATAFGNEAVMLMLLSMFFLGMLQDSQVTQWLSNKLLGAKFVQGRPWALTAFMIIAPAFLSIVVNQTLVALIMLVVYQSIFEQAGYKKGDMYPAMVLMGFMILCCIALSIFPFRGWCLMTVGMAMKAGIEIDMGGWIISELLFLVAASVGWMLVMRVTPGCKVDKLKAVDISTLQKESKPLTKRQKAVLTILLINIIGCIVLSFVAGPTGIRMYFGKIGVYGWVVLLIAVAMIWHVDGKPVLDKKTAPGYFYWDLILVVATAMVVAGQMTSETTGITTLMGAIMKPLFGLPSFAFLMAIGVITLLLTNVFNNVAVTITMMTIAMAAAQHSDFNLQVALMLITVFGVIGLLTPAGSINGAMIHAHEYTTTKSAYIAGVIMIVFLSVLCALVLLPAGMFFMK